MPMWQAILNVDLLIFVSPVYALRTTAQMKTLLDHLCVHWMVHRPDERMFNKRAVILTNAVGVFNGGAQKDIATSLSWLGVSDIKKLGIGLLEGVIWNQLSDKRKNIIIKKTKKIAEKYKKTRTVHKKIRMIMKFAISKIIHQAVARKDKILSVNNQYWVDKGWIKV